VEQLRYMEYLADSHSELGVKIKEFKEKVKQMQFENQVRTEKLEES